MLLFLVLLTAVVILTYIYVNRKYNERYWKRRGVKYFAESKTFGIFWDYIVKNRPMFELFSDIYKKYADEPAVGMASFSAPNLFVRDLTNVQHVLHLDFKSFSHRGIDVAEEDKLADSILFMNGKRWKLMRQSMTPLFTAAKLKNMYYIMDRSGLDFVDYLNKHPEKLNGNIFDTLTTFCCAAIVASIFGIGTESIFDSPFLTTARTALAPTFWSNFKFSLSSISPTLFKALKLKLFGEHEDFFISVIKQVIRQREKENVKKHDFADICVSLQKQGILYDLETEYELKPTDELMAAQAFFFLVAGVDPSASAMFASLLELGRNPEIMKRVHDEIDHVFEKTNGKLTYDAVNEMEYLEKVVNEGMRKYPPVGFLSRRCVEDTVLPVGNIKVDKGTNVYTPVYDIHRDPTYYPEPDVFDPERFNNKTLPITYMAFGKGNRLCIGSRFSRLQIKTGLVHMLRYFTPRTKINGKEIIYKKLSFQVRPDNVDVKLLPGINKNSS
ncbi:cytochrome P450 6B5-like [Battus philenor]|uniref:cytochrome P450 6B5-like n=1 Tax=Battus philenor TaxID=42288 RepID=UPI0035D01452